MEIIILFILFLVIFLIQRFRKNKDNKIIDSEECKQYVNSVNSFLNEINFAKKNYFNHKKQEDLIKRYKKIYDLSDTYPYKLIDSAETRTFKTKYRNLEDYIKIWNEKYIKKELSECKEMFDNIDGKSLDKQQREAVLYDEINNLVVAGAGSGKTLTVSAKVKYLVERKGIDPRKILLISFTRKAANEMNERISSKLNINVNAVTFHKLGLGIITRSNNNRPDIEPNLNKIISDYLEKNIIYKNNKTKEIIFFMGIYINLPKDWEEFDNLGEMYEYNKNIDYETLKGKLSIKKHNKEKIDKLKNNKKTIKGETVKSLEEVMIANFLFLNGIEYIYEYVYPYEQEDTFKKKYRPDFYLPEYDIYIEHFGVNKEFRTPWLSKIEERKYLDGIVWKREIHNKNKTKLIETYSYYNKNGVLLKALEEKLKVNKVNLVEIDYMEIYEKLYVEYKDKYFKEFTKLISSFLSLFKANGYKYTKFEELKVNAEKIDNNFVKNRTIYFLNVVKSAYVYYQKTLDKRNKIDFNDMINEATDIIKKGSYGIEYDYIIVDEFQDISLSRYKLIKAIQDTTNSKIVCVGDDWQSIYRFAGSNIEIFTNFEKYFGYSEKLKIEKTYRNSQQLIDITGKFIMENKNQIKKELISKKQHSNPIRIFSYSVYKTIVFEKIIDEIVERFGDKTEILVLGRNNFDIDFINEETHHLTKDKNKKRKFKLKKSSNAVIIKSTKYPNLDISFLTVHRAKGVESENVILINADNKLLGFPNKISDDSLLSMVLTDDDNYAYAEERRLFYVALTRTKNATYIVSEENNMSIFVKELIKNHYEQIESNTEDVKTKDNPKCPKCEEGTIVLRKNSSNNSLFLGCTHYPLCDFTNKDIEIINNQIKCNQCGGYMVKRKGKYGEFYGCTNYPYCKNTLEIYDKEEIIASNR